MAYSGSPAAASLHGSSTSAHSGLRRQASSPPVPMAGGRSPARSSENDHQLEKLEFALAVAMTRGDALRVKSLREEIAALGGNCEEPGT